MRLLSSGVLYDGIGAMMIATAGRLLGYSLVFALFCIIESCHTAEIPYVFQAMDIIRSILHHGSSMHNKKRLLPNIHGHSECLSGAMEQRIVWTKEKRYTTTSNSSDGSQNSRHKQKIPATAQTSLGTIL
jgi:hypothetical protein